MEFKFFKEKDGKEKTEEETGPKAGDTEKIIDLLVESMRKIPVKGEKETLPEKEIAEKIIETEKFIDVLAGIRRENREKEEKTHVILATYNRVGKGDLPRKTEREDLILDIWAGNPDMPPSEKEVKDFFKKSADILERQLMYMEQGPLVIFYGGSGENFNEAAKTIDHLNFLTELLEEEKKPKFFLLTCQCELNQKKKIALPLIKAGRLNGLICGQKNDCGGFNDLEKIADSLIGKKEKELIS